MNRCNIILVIIYISNLYAIGLDAQKLKIVTSTSIFANMIASVGDSLVDIKSIVPIGADPHGYEPTPGDIKLIADADMIMINGLELEIWINKVIQNINFPKDKVIVITDGIRPLSSKEYVNSKDPHAWMTAKNGLVYIENIYKAINKHIPDSQKPQLQDYYHAYRKKLIEVDHYISEKINSIPPKKRKLVTAHDAFQYFGQAYGIELYPLQGISPESDILIKDFQKTIRLIKKYEIPAIFVESTINPKTIENLADEADCLIGGKLHADSLSDSLGQAPDYVSMLISNTTTIANGLMISYQNNSKNKSTQRTYHLYGIVFLIMILSFLFMIKSFAK